MTIMELEVVLVEGGEGTITVVGEEVSNQFNWLKKDMSIPGKRRKHNDAFKEGKESHCGWS